MNRTLDPDLTHDSLFGGRLQVAQPRTGYRFSIDAVILAQSVNPIPGERILDLGTGCGIVPMILALRSQETHITGVEVQPVLAEIARANVAANAMQNRVRILEMDMQRLEVKSIGGRVKRVVSNPPYRKAASGRINPDSQRAVARHEISITAAQVIETAERLLAVGGRLNMIHTAERLPELFTRLQRSDLEPKFLRTIHSGQGTVAYRILMTAVKGGRPGVRIAPPLVIYKNRGQYTDEVQQMFEL